MLISSVIKIFLLMLLLGQINCSLFQKKIEPEEINYDDKASKDALAKFQRASSFMEVENYQKALISFKRLQVAHPASRFALQTHFNIGACQEALGQCQAAARSYRKAAQLAKTSHQRLEARALLRLSYAYECLGDNDKVVVSLLDVNNRREHLPLEVAAAELPARLAAAYARAGNRDQARIYFKRAELGLVRIQAQPKKAKIKQEILGKTLFLMGNLKETSGREVKGIEYLSNLQSLQKYLLKSVEMRSKVWSPRAAKNLMSSYQKIWKYFQHPEPTADDQEMVHRKIIEFRIEIAELALEGIRQLRVSRFPDENPSSLEKKLFKFIAQEERKFSNYILNHDLGLPLTKEAKKLQALKREGRTYRPNPMLERNSKRNQPLPKKKK